MEYQVPQFIEVEDKIIGPLTLKQFIYLAGCAGLCAIFYFYLPFLFAIVLILPIGALGIALAFYKVHGKPFASVLESAFSYYTGAKLFLWKKEDKPQKAEPEKAAASFLEKQGTRATPRLTSGKLHELAWSLDVKDKQQPQ